MQRVNFKNRLTKKTTLGTKKWKSLKRSTIFALKKEQVRTLLPIREKLKIQCVGRMIKERIKDWRKSNVLKKRNEKSRKS